MNFYNIIDMLYTKKKTDVFIDTQLNITLLKWLSYDRDNLTALKKIMKYHLSIPAQHFFYLLYFNVPKKYKAPFLRKIEKAKVTENKLSDKVKYVLQWSNSDLRKNNKIINEVVIKNAKHWKKELGVK